MFHRDDTAMVSSSSPLQVRMLVVNEPLPVKVTKYYTDRIYNRDLKKARVQLEYSFTLRLDYYNQYIYIYK